MEFEKKIAPRDISNFYVPILRIVASIFLILSFSFELYPLFNLGISASSIPRFLSLAISGLLFIFYLLELRLEFKRTYVKAAYFRLAMALMEVLYIGKLSYSGMLLFNMTVHDSILWLNIFQNVFVILIILLLLVKNVLRMKRSF